MGGVNVLHPQDCLKDHDNFFSTPAKSRRAPKPSPNFSNPSSSSPNFARSDGRKRSPPAGVRKGRAAAAMVADPPAVAVAKNLVMGQVKILKRGEPLNELTAVLKDANDQKVSHCPANDFAGDRRLIGGRKVSKKAQKEKKRIANSSPKIEVLSPNPKIEVTNPKVGVLNVDDFALSSTDRLGPDPEMVPKQMKKNIADFFFAGSAFVDSPPPSSVPLPGFFTKNFAAADPSSDLRRMLGLTLS